MSKEMEDAIARTAKHDAAMLDVVRAAHAAYVARADYLAALRDDRPTFEATLAIVRTINAEDEAVAAFQAVRVALGCAPNLP